MPITSVTSDTDALTLTAIGEYPVAVQRLWGAWADPRQLERFWGPPQWPATFTRHDLKAGGRSEYHMSGPKGERVSGYWAFDFVQAPRLIELRDGFLGPDGQPDPAQPETRMQLSFEVTTTGSRFVAVSTFASLEAMQQLLAMGMFEGLQAALAQMDEVLADLRDHSETLSASTEIIDDTHVVVRREVRGSLPQVWRAHHEAALLQRWLLGPDGWTMPVCEVPHTIGDSYRYEWQSDADGGRFGFTGELLEAEPPRRAVTTERMIGIDAPGTVNELILSPRPGGRTLIEVRITYPTKDLRDMILATGMVDGMEVSYARLQAEILD